MSNCKACGGIYDLRMGVCFSCANFESLIAENKDMYDKPIIKTISGSDALNILAAIISHYRNNVAPTETKEVEI